MLSFRVLINSMQLHSMQVSEKRRVDEPEYSKFIELDPEASFT